MRVMPRVVGLAIAVAACGGGDRKTDEQQAAPPAQQPAPAAGAPAATGATHDVDMVLEGTSYKYVPNQLTIKSGDVVRFHNKNGFPHNISFWSDSIPAGAASALNAGMADQMAPLQSPLMTQPDAIYTVSFAGAPTGEYKFYCLPHLALGMAGKITVQ